MNTKPLNSYNVHECCYLSKCFLLFVMNSYYHISNVILYVCEGKEYWVHTEFLQGLLLLVYTNCSVSYLMSSKICVQEYAHISVIIV